MQLTSALLLCFTGALAASQQSGSHSQTGSQTGVTSTPSQQAGTRTATQAGSANTATATGAQTSGGCLTQSDASYLVNGYVNDIAGPNYNASAADQLIADNATSTSQTVLALGGATGSALQGVTYPNKTAILDSEKNKAFKLDITVNGIDAVGCESIGWRWTGVPNGKAAVRGISIFNAVKNESVPTGWQIKTIYGEVNSFTLAEDLGANCTLPPPP